MQKVNKMKNSGILLPLNIFVGKCSHQLFPAGRSEQYPSTKKSTFLKIKMQSRDNQVPRLPSGPAHHGPLNRAIGIPILSQKYHD